MTLTSTAKADHYFVLYLAQLNRANQIEKTLEKCKNTLRLCDTALNDQKALVIKQDESIARLSKELGESKGREAELPWYVYVGLGALGGLVGGIYLLR